MTNFEFHAFLDASTRLTGFGRADLLGTGCAEEFWELVRKEAPEPALDALVSGEESAVDAAVIELWYLGIWRGTMGTEGVVVSPRAYREGLVWRAMGAHPMGAKQPGFGSWALPPEMEKTP